MRVWVHLNMCFDDEANIVTKRKECARTHTHTCYTIVGFSLNSSNANVLFYPASSPTLLIILTDSQANVHVFHPHIRDHP